MLLLFICFIASASFNGWPIGKLGMGFVAMMFAVLMLCKFKSSVGKFYSGIDWDLLFFFVYLFVAIYAMEQAKVLDLIGKGIAPIIGMGPNLGGGLLLVSSAFASSVTDNIPLAAVLTDRPPTGSLKPLTPQDRHGSEVPASFALSGATQSDR